MERRRLHVAASTALAPPGAKGARGGSAEAWARLMVGQL
jgi:hypothetical protein